MSHAPLQHNIRGDSLADILERVLDKGIVIAGDVSISLVGVELLTIKIRLLVTTVDKAIELGVNWWQSDPTLSASSAKVEQENRTLKGRVAILEQRLALHDLEAAP
jgi:hypothetical protein